MATSQHNVTIIGRFRNRITQGIQRANKALNDFSGRIQKMQNQIFMVGISLLFFGMQLQRTFQSIARAGITAFTKVMESSDRMGTAVQRLGVHWRFLKFSIGSAINAALEPMLPKILNIVDSISRWVQQNKKLTSGILLWGFVIGSALFILSTLALGIVQGVIPAITGLVSWIKSGAIVTFIRWAAIIAAIVLAITAVADAFNTLKSNAKDSNKKTSESTITLGKIIAGVVKVIVGVITFLAKSAFGLGVAIGAFWEMFWHGIQFFGKKIINFVTRIINDSLEPAIEMINSLIRKWNKLSRKLGVGAQISLIDTGIKLDTADAEKSLKDFNDTFERTRDFIKDLDPGSGFEGLFSDQGGGGKKGNKSGDKGGKAKNALDRIQNIEDSMGEGENNQTVVNQENNFNFTETDRDEMQKEVQKALDDANEEVKKRRQSR